MNKERLIELIKQDLTTLEMLREKITVGIKAIEYGMGDELLGYIKRSKSLIEIDFSSVTVPYIIVKIYEDKSLSKHVPAYMVDLLHKHGDTYSYVYTDDEIGVLKIDAIVDVIIFLVIELYLQFITKQSKLEGYNESL